MSRSEMLANSPSTSMDRGHLSRLDPAKVDVIYTAQERIQRIAAACRGESRTGRVTQRVLRLASGVCFNTRSEFKTH